VDLKVQKSNYAYAKKKLNKEGLKIFMFKGTVFSYSFCKNKKKQKP